MESRMKESHAEGPASHGGPESCDGFLGTPRTRVRIRREIAKGGRAGDVFLPDAVVVKLRKFWAHKRRRGGCILAASCA